MKQIIFVLSFILVILFNTGCSTFAYHRPENETPDGGVKIEFGAKDGVHIGDKVNVYENKCSVSGRGGNRCKFKLVGTMTLYKVEDANSYAKPDGSLALSEEMVFKLEKHCEKNPKECGQE